MSQSLSNQEISETDESLTERTRLVAGYKKPRDSRRMQKSAFSINSTCEETEESSSLSPTSSNLGKLLDVLKRSLPCWRRSKTEEGGQLRIITLHGGGGEFKTNRISTTKYNLLTFVPKFLFDQFRRFANFFFLIIVLLQQIPDVSPTGRYSTAVPLVFVLSVSALKELIEDMIRFKADNDINNRVVEVLRPDTRADVRWKDVKAGDVVKVVNNKFFPADLILLKSSEPSGRCYIETANLDGETNLKVRECHSSTRECTDESVCDLKGFIECAAPDKKLYEFTGNLVLLRDNGEEERLPVTADHILLRDAQLRNTDCVYGLVVYTGHESKIMKNARTVPLKRSNMDHVTNKQIVIMVIVLLCLSLLSGIAALTWNLTAGKDHWYLRLNIHSQAIAIKDFVYSSLTFFILYNNLIPISLIVTQEIARILQGIFIKMDLSIYDESTDTPTRVRNSNLNEELGQVQFVFSDKTGTLTQNIMKFRQCSINSKLYKIDEESSSNKSIQTISEGMRGRDSFQVCEFLRALALCHSVVPEYVNGKLYYRSVSPDEEALVKAAREMNVVFEFSQNNSIRINVNGAEENYVLLNVLEFTSARKRMSVILRTPNGSIKLICKGADNIIYDRLASTNDQLAVTTQQHLDDYASEGLRTLCVAEAHLSEEEYESWNAEYYKACTATADRENRIAEVAELIEKNLTLLGATAIEDKLQESVPETIEKLRRAGLKVWVLTGDKMETAINIGYSSKQLTNEMNILQFTHTTEEGVITKLNEELEKIRGNTINVAVVINGQALSYVLHSERASELFLELGLLSDSVICCRATPSQKAEVVELVKHKRKNTITLAIGDGANDVSMIQAAHIGVGISGREGLQATLASDYAIAQFRFLGTLILVHGAWSYQRMSKVIAFSFYKNICLYIIEFWFIFSSGYSGQAIFQRWTIAFYNLLFTGAVPFVFGVFDQDVSAETRLKKPELYTKGGRFGYKMFWLWILLSVVHSLVLYYGTYLAMPYGSSLADGKTTDLLYAGNIIYTGTVVTVNVLVGIVSGHWTIITHLCIWCSIALWIVFLLPFSFLWPTLPIASDMFGGALILYSSLMFYALSFLLLPSVTLLPILLYYGLRYLVSPDEIMLARVEEINSKSSAVLCQSLLKCFTRKHDSYVAVNNDLDTPLQTF